MRKFTRLSCRRTGRSVLVALALLELSGAVAGPAQVIGNAADCATSRAQAELGRVHAALYAWYLDVVSGSAPFAAVAPLGRAAAGDPLCPGSPPVDVAQVPTISVAELRALLVPGYIAAIPEFDPWRRPYDYRLNLPELLSFPVLALRSSGEDGLFAGPTYEIGTTTGPADDLVIFNATWVRQPPRLDPVSRQQVTVERVDVLGAAMLSHMLDIVSGVRTPAGGPEVDLGEIAPISPVALAAVLQSPSSTPSASPRQTAGVTRSTCARTTTRSSLPTCPSAAPDATG